MKDFVQKTFPGLAGKIGIVSLLAICFALFVANADAQTTLVNYDFASAVAGTPCTASPLSTATGVTSAFSTGGTVGGGTCTTPAGAAVASPPAFVANASNQSVSVSSFASTSTNFFQFQLSGVSSYQDYMLFFQARRSGTGPVNVDVQYSLDGTSFTTFSTIQPPNSTTFTAATAFTIDLSSVVAIENQPTVYFRLLGRDGTSAAGTFVIDNFQVQATAGAVLPDLTISQSAPSSVTVGNSYNYTLTVNNAGGTSLTTVDVDFTIPSGVTYNAAVSNCTSTTLTSGVVQFRGCSVSANSSTTFTVNVIAPATTQTITSTGTNVVVDPNNTIAESNEGNNTAATVTTDITAGTTAAVVDVGGKIINIKGRPIAGVLVTLTDTSGKKLSAYTDSSGNYLFEAVEVGQLLVFEARAKRYSFTQPLQVVSLSEENATVNFVGYEERRAF